MAINTLLAVSLMVLISRVDGQQGPSQCWLADNLAQELRAQLSPKSLVLLPFTSSYRRDIVLRSTNFNSFPAATVHPATVKDVVTAVNFAIRYNLKLTVKGTGHDYNGRCSADCSLNINTRLLNDVLFDAPNNKTFFGAGAAFGDVLKPAVLKHGKVVVSGHDLTVGPGGCLTGGCHGALSRQYGFGADSVTAFVLVTPTGQLVKASNRGLHRMNLKADGNLEQKEGKLITSDASLFWALRGGGGGTLGVIVQVAMRLVPAPKAVRSVTVAWPLFDTQGSPIKDMFNRFVFNATYWDSLSPKWAAWSVASIPRDCQAPDGTTATAAAACFGQAALSFIYTGDDPLAIDNTPGMKQIMNYKAPWVSDITFYSTTTSYKNYYDWAYSNADTSNYMRQFISNVLLEPQDFNPTTTDRLFEALGLMGQAAAVPQAGPDSFETVGYVINIVGGGNIPKHPEAAKACINKRFRNFLAEVVLSVGGKDPAWDLRGYKAVSDGMASLYKAYPASYVNEISSAEGFNVIPNWRTRFWGDNYAKLLTVKEQYDPQKRMVVPYGLGWEGP